MKFQVEEVKGMDCYTNFYGMDITRDKLCTLVKKWHTLVEAFVQTKTVDGYLMRVFSMLILFLLSIFSGLIGHQATPEFTHRFKSLC